MAQTTGGIARSIYKVEVSTDGTNWTDVSGQAVTVSPSGGEQQTGTQFTADGAAPIVVNSNKNDAITVEVSVVYTESASEGYVIVYNRYVGSDKTVWLRYSPAGGGSGQKRYFTSNAAGTLAKVPIVACLPPEVDSSSGDPVLGSFSVITPRLTVETIA